MKSSYLSKNKLTRRNMMKLMGATAGASMITLPGNLSANIPNSGKLRFQIETGPGTDFLKVVEEFRKDVPGIKVDYSQVDPGSVGPHWARNAMRNGVVDLASNESPKFFFLDPVLEMDLLAPLDEYNELYNWEKFIHPNAIKVSRRSGKLWTLPLYYEVTGALYRKSLLKKLGGKEPQNWNDFVDMLKEIKSMGIIPYGTGQRGFGFIMMMHYQMWASTGGVSGKGSITDVIFGNGKFTDEPSVRAAQGILDLFNMGLIDKDILSIDLTNSAERFFKGDLALLSSGTWAFPECQRRLGNDWDMMTVPGPGGNKPVWCLGETEAFVIPKNAKDPKAAARFLDYCVQGNGAKILVESGNLLSTSAYSHLAIPQVKKLPIVTGEPSSLLIFGWLPEPSQDAYQQGLGGMLGGRLSPEQWAENVQKAWEQDLETLNVNRSDLL